MRGLDYYCHTAFEFITDALGAQGTVLGGGRYDGLSEMLGGPPVPGVGWAAGVERLAMLVGDVEPAAPRVAVMPMDGDAEGAAFALAESLRGAGIAVDLPAGGAIGKRLKKADRAGVRIAVILGSDEVAGGSAQILRPRRRHAAGSAAGRACLGSSWHAWRRPGVMSIEQSMDKVLARRDEVESRLADAASMSPDELASLSRELSELRPVCEQIDLVRRLEGDRDAAVMLAEEAADDAEMAEMAQAEIQEIEARLPEEMNSLQLLLLPRDRDDSRNAILEVRAGTGGDEAALFASDLFGMYQRFAAKHGWRFEVMEVSETGIGGYKEATANIAGSDVFARLKFESGVHRVQRVPETEAGGRIHTSAATVAVLPEAEDVDIDVQESDLRIDVFRASGPGGQSVNTTDSAVRITHIPTGIVVSQQDEKSQHKNRAKAMKILRARLYDAERARLQAERAASRKGQVGSGDRSERIRTYNFPQGRVTDHRINLTLYKLDKVIAGEALDEVVEALVAEDQAQRLAEGGE